MLSQIELRRDRSDGHAQPRRRGALRHPAGADGAAPGARGGRCGAKLFVRTPRGMRLTEAGEAFLPYAERALDPHGRAPGLNAFERGGAGRLAIGAAPAVTTYVLPALLKRFATSLPARAGQRSHRPLRGGARARAPRAGRRRPRPRAAAPGHREHAALRGRARPRRRPRPSLRAARTHPDRGDRRASS